MKVLAIFVDMLNTKYFSVYNENQKKLNSLEKLLEETHEFGFGGTYFTNCYTQGPDTGRSISQLWSGVPPFKNGCVKRAHYPKFFLKEPSFLSSLEKNGYNFNFFSCKENKLVGFYPPDFNETPYFHDQFNLDLFFKNIDYSNENLFTMITLDDYHWIIDDFGPTDKSAVKAINLITKILKEKILTKDVLSHYDEFIIFSDHSHVLDYEYVNVPEDVFLKNFSARSKLFLFWSNKNTNEFQINAKLSTIGDIYATLLNKCKISFFNEYSIDLFSDKEIEYFILEDFQRFNPGILVPVDTWIYIDKKGYYIENLQKIVYKSVDTERVKQIFCQEFNSYKEFMEEKKVMNYYDDLKNTLEKTYTLTNLKRLGKRKKKLIKIINRAKLVLKKSFGGK